MAKSSRAFQLAANRAYWEKQVMQWGVSGLSQAEYCRKHHLKSHQFLYWKQKMTRQEATPRFVQVDLHPVPDPDPDAGVSSPLRVIFSDRLCIEIHKGFDPATLEQVILSLRRAGC